MKHSFILRFYSFSINLFLIFKYIKIDKITEFDDNSFILSKTIKFGFLSAYSVLGLFTGKYPHYSIAESEKVQGLPKSFFIFLICKKFGHFNYWLYFFIYFLNYKFLIFKNPPVLYLIFH